MPDEKFDYIEYLAWKKQNQLRDKKNTRYTNFWKTLGVNVINI